MLDRDDDCVDADGDAGAVVEAVLASDLSTKALGLKRAQAGGNWKAVLGQVFNLEWSRFDYFILLGFSMSKVTGKKSQVEYKID